MSASKVYLGSLRLKAQQKADLENSPNIGTSEWNGLIQDAHKELYDLMVAAYGNEWFINNPMEPYLFTPSGQYNLLPPDFYKLISIGMQSGNLWIPLKRFEELEGGSYTLSDYSINTNYNSPMRYRISGNFIEFMPMSYSTSGAIQIKYVPKPPNLQFEPVCTTTLSSPSITCSETLDLLPGMSVYGPGIPDDTTVVSVDSNLSTVVLSRAAVATQPFVVLFFWRDDAVVEGVAGWEKYIIVDAAINAGVKQEAELSDLKDIKNEMKQRLIDMAEGRDIGQAFHVTDALGGRNYGGHY